MVYRQIKIIENFNHFILKVHGRSCLLKAGRDQFIHQQINYYVFHIYEFQLKYICQQTKNTLCDYILLYHRQNELDLINSYYYKHHYTYYLYYKAVNQSLYN